MREQTPSTASDAQKTPDPEPSSQTGPSPDLTTGESAHSPSSLQELIERVSGHGLKLSGSDEDAGLAEVLPFPFLALVGQREMKLALMLSLINSSIGGVLLIGPRGTGKTTSVRSLVDLLPQVPRSLCHYGCMPEDIETGGIDAVCPDCARKFAQGDPLTRMDRVRLVELPLNARLEDVVGGLDERAAVHDRMRIRRGILAQADRNLLYVDEVNLLNDEIVDAILDAAAQGAFTVRRGPISANYRARLTLIGSIESRGRPAAPADPGSLRAAHHGPRPGGRLRASGGLPACLCLPDQSQIHGRSLFRRNRLSSRRNPISPRPSQARDNQRSCRPTWSGCG